jgi:hypothetical protein
MSSIFTCGPFLHLILIWATGREFCLIPALDGATRWCPNHAHMTARSRPAAAIELSYINLPALKLVKENRSPTKAPILPLQAGFWELRETAANRGLSFFLILFLFSAFTASFWHHCVFWSAKNPARMPRHTFACYVYWRCLVTIYWLSACNVIPTCSAFVYGILIHLTSPSFRHLRHFIHVAEINYIFIKSCLHRFY